MVPAARASRLPLALFLAAACGGAGVPADGGVNDGGTGGESRGGAGGQGGPGGDGGEAGQGGEGGDGGEGGEGGRPVLVPDPRSCPDDVPPLAVRGAARAVGLVSGDANDNLNALSSLDGGWVFAGTLSHGADLGDGPASVPDLGDGFVFTPSFLRVFAAEGLDAVTALATLPDGDHVVSVRLATFTPNAAAELHRLDGATGATEWSRPLDQPIEQLVAHPSGDVFTARICSASEEAFAPRFCVDRRGPDGAVIWEKRFGGDYRCEKPRLLLDPEGHVVVTGHTGQEHAAVDFGDGELVWGSTGYSFVLELDGATGALRWKRPLLAPAGEWGHSDVHGVALAPNGDVLVAGSYWNQLATGGPVLTEGENTVFLARWSGDDGAHRFATPAPGLVLDLGAALALDGDAMVIAAPAIDVIRVGDLTLGEESTGSLVLLLASTSTGEIVDGAVLLEAGWIELRGFHHVCGALRVGVEVSGDARVGEEAPISARFFDVLLVEVEL